MTQMTQMTHYPPSWGGMSGLKDVKMSEEASEPLEDGRTAGERMTTEQALASLTYADYLRAARYAG